MLTPSEVGLMKANAKVHKEVFDNIRTMFKPWLTAQAVDDMCAEVAKKHNVLCAFKWQYGFPNNICISVNDVIAHGRIRKDMVFREWDLVNFDFGIRDKKVWVNTDSWISLICGWADKNPKAAHMIEVNLKALYAWIKMARVWNRIGDISAAIQKEVEAWWYKIVKDLTGHSIGKKIHEKPYIPNYGKAGTGPFIKKWMTLAIEPLIWETSGEIEERWDWEIYIKDGSLGCQFEHTILVTDGEAEIII